MTSVAECFAELKDSEKGAELTDACISSLTNVMKEWHVVTVTKLLIEYGAWSCRHPLCIVKDNNEYDNMLEMQKKMSTRIRYRYSYQRATRNNLCKSCANIPEELTAKCMITGIDTFQSELERKCDVVKSMEMVHNTLRKLIADKDDW